MTAYYRFRSTRLSVDEFRATGESELVVWMFRLRKLLGHDGPGLYWTDSSQLEIIEPSQVAVPAQLAAVQQMIDEARASRLEVVFWSRSPSLRGGHALSATLLSDCRRFDAVAAASFSAAQSDDGVSTAFVCWSYRPNGTSIGTGNVRQLVPAPSNFLREHLPGASVADVIAWHRKRLDGTEIQLGPGRDALLAVHHRQSKLSTDFLRARGILVPLSDEEVRAIKAI